MRHRLHHIGARGALVLATVCIVSSGFVVAAAPTSAAAAALAPPFNECPAINNSPSCEILLVINSDRSISVYGDPNVGSYDDGGDDTLVGVLNNSSSAAGAMVVAGPGSDLADFDGDGICTYVSCSWPAPEGYEGPGTHYTLDPNGSLDDVEVDFTAAGGLQPGGSTYFSLEGALTSAELTAYSGGYISVSPQSGPPGTVFTVSYSCSQLAGFGGLVFPNQPDVTPDDSVSADPVPAGAGRYTEKFQVGPVGQYFLQPDCGSIGQSIGVTITPWSSNYIALGDSYSSGEGSGPPWDKGTNDSSENMCHRSSNSWGHIVQKRFSVSFPSVRLEACSGALIEDYLRFNPDRALNIANPTPPSTTDDGFVDIPGEIPQLDHVSGSTQLVTMTIGGNDVGFPNILTDCVVVHNGPGRQGCAERAKQGRALDALFSDLQTGRSAGCAALPGLDPESWKASQLCSDVRVPSLHELYDDVASRLGPGGQLLVEGYPQLFGSQFGTVNRFKGCRVGTALGFYDAGISADDISWLNTQATRLNGIIAAEVAKAAAATSRPDVSIVFVPVDSAFNNHRLCDKSTSYFNGLQFQGNRPSTVGPKNTSFHPNVQGQQAYATAVNNALA